MEFITELLKNFGNSVWALIVAILLFGVYRLWLTLEKERADRNEDKALQLKEINGFRESALTHEARHAAKLQELNEDYLEKLERVHQARIDDAERFAASLTKSNEKVHETLTTFSKFVDMLEFGPRRGLK